MLGWGGGGMTGVHEYVGGTCVSVILSSAGDMIARSVMKGEKVYVFGSGQCRR